MFDPDDDDTWSHVPNGGASCRPSWFPRMWSTWTGIAKSSTAVLLRSSFPPRHPSCGTGPGRADARLPGTVSFSWTTASLQRPWFQPTVFASPAWRFTDSLILSDGCAPPRGKCTGYVSALLLLRDVTVTAPLPRQVWWQRWLRRASTPRSASELLRTDHDDIFIPAFVVQRLSCSPNPNPKLEWSTAVPDPEIMLVNPETVAPGDSVTLTGPQLGQLTTVIVGGVSVPAQAIPYTQLRFTAPLVAAGNTADVTVVGTSPASPAMKLTYLAPPTITSIDPDHGTPGTPVVVHGSGLSTVTQVTFGGSPAQVGVPTDTALPVAAPDAGLPPGTIVDVTVANSDGASRKPGHFRYTRSHLAWPWWAAAGAAMAILAAAIVWVVVSHTSQVSMPQLRRPHRTISPCCY